MNDEEQKVTLMDSVVFQPKGVTWVTEVHIANTHDKQYIRKSYQSTMDLTKVQLLDANISVDDYSTPEVDQGMMCGHSSHNHTVTPSDLGGSANITEENLVPSVKLNSKRPPEKPPRKSQLTSKPSTESALAKGGEFVTISVPSLVSHPDTHSLMEPGSRLSSFAPRSSTVRKSKGHSRSKSDTGNLKKIAHQDLSLTLTLGGLLEGSSNTTNIQPPSKLSPTSPARVTPLSSSSHTLKSPKSPRRDGNGYKSQNSLQMPKSPTFQKLQESVTTAAVSQKQDVGHDKQITRVDTNTKGSADKSKKRSSVHHPTSQIQSVGEGGPRRGASIRKQQYNEMLKELTTVKARSKQVDKDGTEEIARSPVDRESPEAKRVSLTQCSDTEPSDDGKSEKKVLPNNGQERYFTFPKPSQQKSSVVHRSASTGSKQPLNTVRKSTFISHDEVVILEDKPLPSLSRLIGHEGSVGSVLGGTLIGCPSSYCPSRDQVSRERNNSEDSAYNGDTENTPTLPPQSTDSGHTLEHKRFQDVEKIDAYDNCSVDGKVDSSQPSSPPESLRISRIAEELQNWSENIVKEGFLHRTFFLRDGKKVRKNWTQSYARYIVAPFNSGSSGLLYFSKTKDDDKKAEIFEFYPPCQLEHSSDKKTSRQQVLGLRNVNETEVLIQFEDKDIADEWFKVLADHDGMQYYMQPVLEKEEKKGKRGSEKLKRVSSTEQLSDSKGITEKLRHFIKRRPAKETLEKKGIYKESVFGGTLAELHVQDKTYIPIFVLQCINHIEKSEENLRTDGLYRISGNAAQIQKIRFEVAQRNYGILSQEKEIHNLSGALKLFFRELKEPLIPFDNYQDFIQATGSEFRKMNQQAEKLTKAVKKLPQENYDTLKLLLQHLLRVSEYESDNRMSLSNLAIVFGPCLLWPRDTSSHDLMTDVMLHNRVIEGLLSDFPKIYSSKR